MNKLQKRTKELLEQSKAKPHRTQGYCGAETVIYPGVLDPEKFAKLIIEDCIASISALDDDAPYDDWTSGHTSAINSAVSVLKDRFGIDG